MSEVQKPAVQMPRRGNHRFRTALDYRYDLYPLPATADVLCPRCRTRCHFSLNERELFDKDEKNGGYGVLTLPIEGVLPGHGSCLNCAHTFSAIDWPEDAYFAVGLAGGTVWAWNKDYLPPLRARIAGDKVLVRQLLVNSAGLHYYLIHFLSRIPKFALITRHRIRLLRTIDDWMHAESSRYSRKR